MIKPKATVEATVASKKLNGNLEGKGIGLIIVVSLLSACFSIVVVWLKRNEAIRVVVVVVLLVSSSSLLLLINEREEREKRTILFCKRKNIPQVLVGYYIYAMKCS
jgi:hypothetical protein